LVNNVAVFWELIKARLFDNNIAIFKVVISKKIKLYTNILLANYKFFLEMAEYMQLNRGVCGPKHNNIYFCAN